jgi:mono/diheme cytochrome c family protein
MRATLVVTSVLAYSICVAATLGAQALGGSAEGKKLKNPVAVNAQSIAAGKASYSKNCRFCHGTEGKGDGPSAPKGSKPSDLTDAQWARGSTDGEIFLVIRDGAGPKFEMKGFKSRMTEQETWHVVNFIRSIGPKKK